MPSTIKPDYERIAKFLTSDFHRFGFPGENKPLAYARRFDGSLSVVAANGQKFLFSAEEVAQADSDLTAMKKLSEKPATRSRSPKGETELKPIQAPQKALRAKKTG